MQFPFRFRRRYDPLLVVLDAVVAVVVAYLAYLLRFQGELPLPAPYPERYRAAAAGLVVSWVLLARSTGLYRRAALQVGSSNLRQGLGAASLVGIALLAADVLVLEGDLSSGWIGLVAAGLLLGGLGSRALLRRSQRAQARFGLGTER